MRIASGLRVSASSRGVRAHVGPRGASALRRRRNQSPPKAMQGTADAARVRELVLERAQQ